MCKIGTTVRQTTRNVKAKRMQRAVTPEEQAAAHDFYLITRRQWAYTYYDIWEDRYIRPEDKSYPQRDFQNGIPAFAKADNNDRAHQDHKAPWFVFKDDIWWPTAQPEGYYRFIDLINSLPEPDDWQAPSGPEYVPDPNGKWFFDGDDRAYRRREYIRPWRYLHTFCHELLHSLRGYGHTASEIPDARHKPIMDAGYRAQHGDVTFTDLRKVALELAAEVPIIHAIRGIEPYSDTVFPDLDYWPCPDSHKPCTGKAQSHSSWESFERGAA